MSDIKNILSQIKALSDDIDVFVPSFNSTIKIKQLSVKQCKDLITMPQNIIHAQYMFFRKFYNILKENIGNDQINNITTIDRIAIMIALRAKALKMYQGIDLNEIIKLIPSIEYNLSPTEINTSNYTFTIEPPTLGVEDGFNKYIINTYKFNKNVNIENAEAAAQELFGELSVIELCKYITKIVIKSNDTEVDMTTLSPAQRKEIVESIQLEELKEIVEYNNKLHTLESKYITYNIGDQSLQISIGPDFFVFVA